MSNTIATLDHNSVFIGSQEFIIKDDSPLSMIDLSMTMSHECTVRAFSTKMLGGEGFKCIWKLSFKKE